jgi:peptidoglycan/xylan/chitin deacetylase (PgdA/CDA1 family)
MNATALPTAPRDAAKIVNRASRKASKLATLPLGGFRRRRPGDVVVLLYHRVGAGTREIDLTVRDFEDQLDYLVERDRVITLDEALQAKGAGGVVLTVDDGYGDFYENVVPAVADRNIPVLLYLATGLVNSRSEDRDELLTWDLLQNAVRTGLVSVGSHTDSHANLARATEPEAELEMVRSKELIEDRLGVPCRHFAFPWSVASSASVRVARRLFDSAALEWKTNRRGRFDAHRLGRTPVLRSDSRFFFRAKVDGRLDGEALLYRAARRGPWRVS